jgi:glycosyltransferase involved in cell wall biosynthesis
MPISVLEAMAAGLPVAATDVGDVRAMLAPENAPEVVVQDAVALATALTGLLADPVRRTLLGVANRRRVEAAFDQETMFAAWYALFSFAQPPRQRAS